MTSHPNRKRSPGQTVTLVRTRSGFANVPDRFCVLEPGYVVDELYESIEVYYLPARYKTAVSNGGQLCVYDARDAHCAIVENGSGRPQLINDGRDMPVLKRKVAA